VRLLIDQTFAAIGVSKRPVTEVSLITTAVGMARAGVGVSVLPLAAARACNLVGLRTLSITEPTVRRPIGFLFRSMSVIPPAARAFVRYVAHQLAQGSH